MPPFPSRRQLVIAGAGLAMARPGVARAEPPGGPFALPPLPYAPETVDAAIDAATMALHHDRHHRAYVDNLNTAIAAAPQLGALSLAVLLRDLGALPETVRMAIRNNGGGHANHMMFWEVMGGAGGAPTGAVGAAIERDLGGWEACRAAFERAAAAHFGSGWAFVAVSSGGKLAIVTKPNQDTPLNDGQQVLFGNDLWEHAYYLRYQDGRAAYLRNWWQVLDWGRIEARYAAARAGTLPV